MLEDMLILSKLKGYADEKTEELEFVEELNIFKMNFNEAIKYLTERFPILFDNLEEITQEVRKNFFWIKKSTDLEITKSLLESLKSSIESKLSLKDWRKNSKDILEKSGFGDKGYYTENVFRTNVRSFYSAGHYEAQSKNINNKPYWLYDGIEDGREREHTRMYNGKVFKADDPIWQRIYPPNGYQCRCRVIALDYEQVIREGYSIFEPTQEEREYDLGVFEGLPGNTNWESKIKKKSKIVDGLLKDIGDLDEA
jgi:phage putative head morphogenesis protein, SPP1 gp7 family